jgi:hypothetical protein
VVIFLPLVLLYQGWTYYVFRQRISPGDFQMPRMATRRPGTPEATPPASAGPASPQADGGPSPAPQ